MRQYVKGGDINKGIAVAVAEGVGCIFFFFNLVVEVLNRALRIKFRFLSFSYFVVVLFSHSHPSHQYTAPSRLLWRIRVITFIDLGAVFVRHVLG